MMFQAGMRLSAALDPALDEELARLVARPDQGAGRDELEAEGEALALEPRERLRPDELLDRQVLVGGPQVLAEREDVAAHGAQVAHRLRHLRVRLAHPEHEAALVAHPAALVEVEDLHRLPGGPPAVAGAPRPA